MAISAREDSMFTVVAVVAEQTGSIGTSDKFVRCTEPYIGTNSNIFKGAVGCHFRKKIHTILTVDLFQWMAGAIEMFGS